jgi:hypothetical protein
VEQASRVEGNVQARLDQPFDTLKSALSRPESWCAIFMLHLNTKYCRVSTQNGQPELVLKMGGKKYQELSSAQFLKFNFQPPSASNDFVEARMHAAEGPTGTSDYDVVLAAIPLPDNKSFIQLRYAYSFNRMGSVAMDSYLSTAGRNKVGFTVTGKDDEGKPQFVKGYRGVLERNAMRYYLAIDSYLASLSQPENARREYALARWFDGTEQYARQLHEVDREDYLKRKRREIERLRSTPPESVN